MPKLRVSACDSEVMLAPDYALHVTSHYTKTSDMQGMMWGESA